MNRLVPSAGVIVISSSTGGGRELALSLADVGFQVLVGVSSNQEKKSYKYSTNKGLIIPKPLMFLQDLNLFFWISRNLVISLAFTTDLRSCRSNTSEI